MNPDLEMQLTPYQELTRKERGFWNLLCTKLGERALFYERLQHDCWVEYTFAPIELEDDDSAYMLGDNEGGFEVFIDSRMPFGMMIDFLLHELAHVQSWAMDEDDDHGPEFGIAYADLYTKYLELYENYWL